MVRRACALVILSGIIAVIGASPALAWTNGGSTGPGLAGGNKYAMHDWILEQAIQLARERDPIGTEWIDTETARLASDDPDYDGSSRYNHVFKQVGSAQGAPQQAADEYSRLLDAYQSGDFSRASRLLGVMSHYYSDVNQPFHTYSHSSTKVYTTVYAKKRYVSQIHLDYERAAWAYISKNREQSVVRREGRPVTDVRSMAVAAALSARGRYKALLKTFIASTNGSVERPNGSVESGRPREVTLMVVNRAINDLADIIVAVPTGKGRSLPPASMKHRMSSRLYRYPRAGQLIGSYVVCLDKSGKPIRGMRVRFTWPARGGKTRTYIRYTNSQGIAHHSLYESSRTKMRRLTVTSKVRSDNREVGRSTVYMVTPRLGKGLAGVRTKVSSKHPRSGTRVRAYARIASAHGRPVAGLPVIFTWSYKGRVVKVRAVTDSRGVARSSRAVGRTAATYPQRVTASTISGGAARRHTVYFRSR